MLELLEPKTIKMAGAALMRAVARTRTCMHTPAFSVLDPGGVVE